MGYAASLVALGANCTVYENCHDLGFLPCRFASKQQHLLKIIGPTELCGTNLVVPDLRAGFSLIIAALMASDTTVLSHAEILFRGYDNLLPKLTGLGAEFTVY